MEFVWPWCSFIIFEAHDIVSVAGSDAYMVVESVEDDRAVCFWFVDGEKIEDTFSVDGLVLVRR